MNNHVKKVNHENFKVTKVFINILIVNRITVNKHLNYITNLDPEENFKLLNL